jgi:hypothetical protein
MSAHPYLDCDRRLPRLQRAAKRRFYEREWVQPGRQASYYETAMSANGTLDTLAMRHRVAHDAAGRARLSFYGRGLLRVYRERRGA